MYDKLINVLHQNQINYQEVHHISEGRCEAISKMRGITQDYLNVSNPCFVPITK